MTTGFQGSAARQAGSALRLVCLFWLAASTFASLAYAGRPSFAQGAAKPGVPAPPSPDERELSPEREKQLTSFLEAVAARQGLQPTGTQPAAPVGARPLFVHLGFSNRGSLTNFQQWPTIFAGSLLMGPREVRPVFDLKLWKGKPEAETVQVNGQAAVGVPNRPRGGQDRITIGMEHYSLTQVNLRCSIYAVMWERGGWTLASVMQRYSAPDAAPATAEQVKAEALKNAELLDRAVAGEQDLAAAVRGYLRHLRRSPPTLPQRGKPPACEPDEAGEGQACGVQVVRWVGSALGRIGDPDPGAGTEEQRQQILKASAEHPEELAAILYGSLSDPELSQSVKEVGFLGPGHIQWHRSHLGVYEILMMQNKATGDRAEVRINLEAYDRKRARKGNAEDDYDRLLRYARACDRWGLLHENQWNESLKLSGKICLYVLDLICAGIPARDVYNVLLDKGLKGRYVELLGAAPDNLPGAAPLSFGSITSFAGFMDKALNGKLKGENQASLEAMTLIVKGIFTANSSLKSRPGAATPQSPGPAPETMNPLYIDWVMKRTLSTTLLLSDDLLPKLLKADKLLAPHPDFVDAMVDAPHQRAWLDRIDLAARLLGQETLRQATMVSELELAAQNPAVARQYGFPNVERARTDRDVARQMLDMLIPQVVSLYYYGGHSQPPDLPIPNLEQAWQKSGVTGLKAGVVSPPGDRKPGRVVQGRPLPTDDPLVARAMKGVKDNPLDPKRHAFLGAILMSKEVWKESEESFREAIRLQPENAAFRSNLANLFALQERWADAEAAQREAITVAPQEAQYRAELAGLFAQQDRFAEAAAVYREAIRLDPTDQQFHGSLGRALLGQKRWAEAAASFREAIRLQPDRATHHIDLGRALLGDRKWAEAEASLRAAIRLRPNDAQAHAYLASALLGQGDKDAAVKEAEEAIRLGLRQHPVFDELGLNP